VYNTALTVTQIQTDMNTPIGPTAPMLSVTSSSSAEISLSWTASTYAPGVAYYVVQRCQGAPCTNFATIAPSVTATTYSDTAVTANQTYDYVVYAVGNDTIQGPNSNVQNATAATGTAPPSTPSSVTAISYGGVAEIRLNWMASTSGVGLANYVIQRCAGTGCSDFAQIATTTTTVYHDTNVAGSTSYSYIIAAVDTLGDVSAYSNPPATATTVVIPTTITYVQGNYATPQGAGVTSVVIPFTNAQKAGDMNVIAVGWSDTVATVMSVTDTSLNTYALAVGPTAGTGQTQAIYYAPNIHQTTANSVTVTFAGGGATFPDVRILEYRGADPIDPVDVSAVGTGTGFISSTAAVQTTYPTDLLFAANLVSTATTTPGIDFVQRILTTPDADIAEDDMATALGSYSANAYLDTAETAGPWVMQMVAFRSQVPSTGAAHPTAPILTGNVISSSEIDLSWTPSTSANGIQEYVLQRCRGVGCSNFAAIAAPTGTVYDNTSLFPNTSYSYRVRAVDTQNNSSAWSNTFIAKTQAVEP
jgi:fibronectin type 3 domain-containing protein